MTSVQDSRGVSTFNVAAKNGQRYRAVTGGDGVARPVKTRPVEVRHLKRKFNDNFSGTSLDMSKWEYRMPGSRSGGRRRCSESSPRSVRVSNDKLELRTKRIPKDRRVYAEHRTACPYGQYYNGHIGSTGGRNGGLRYGFMAARMKLQPQRGHHAGFWSQPLDTTARTGAEIDAMEYYGGTSPNERIQHSIYRRSALRAKAFESRAYLLGRNKTFSNSYHVFSVQWTPNHYIFRIDGHETFRTKRAISRTEQYLIVSLLSSDWELPNLPRGRLKPLYVDWVRTWEY